MGAETGVLVFLAVSCALLLFSIAIDWEKK
jgi:hypothetical protein